jgi:16S rRNA (adenine1518-N6/adenine1519-N6)-dimethyltransferase
MSVKTTLHARNLRPRKKWGQHFLTDQRILESIADAAEVEPTDIVLEIGPGLGHLTRVLARRARRVIAVEIDTGLAAQLKNDFADTANVFVAPGDFLNAAPIDWILSCGEQPLDVSSYKVVANLPYYITSAILRHILDAHVKPQIIVVMVQREVAQRIVAQPPAMNLLAVSVQYYAQPRIVRTIAAGAFYPPPKVDSAVVRLDVHAVRREHTTPAKFFELVRAGFGERRKQLFNALRHGLTCDAAVIARALTRAQIAPTRRAETLTLAEWLALERALAH